jgi:hypothetical protein
LILPDPGDFLGECGKLLVRQRLPAGKLLVFGFAARMLRLEIAYRTGLRGGASDMGTKSERCAKRGRPAPWKNPDHPSAAQPIADLAPILAYRLYGAGR